MSRALLLLALAGCSHDGVGEPLGRGRHEIEETYATIGVPTGWLLDPERVPIDEAGRTGEAAMVYLGDVRRPRALLLVGRLDTKKAQPFDCDEAERLAAHLFRRGLDSDPVIELTCSVPALNYTVEGHMREGVHNWRVAARFRGRQVDGERRLHVAAAAARDSESASRRTIALLAGVRFERAEASESAQPQPRSRRRSRRKMRRGRVGDRRGRRSRGRRDRKSRGKRDGPQRVPGF